jgi:hypothetical protein
VSADACSDTTRTGPTPKAALARSAHHFRARSQIEWAAAKTIVQKASVGCMTPSAYSGD